MKKRLMCALMLLVLLMSMATMAMAGSAKKDVSEKDFAKLEAMVVKANEKIDKAVAQAQKTAKDDVAELLKKVEKTVAPVFKFADEIGAEVVCEIEYYWIDGRQVAIDPLKVINRKSSK